MPIYSRNSASNMTIVANENYSYQDMGRILAESAQNDMILFNAVLRSDFQEQAAITEGTMVASELQSFREASVKEFWNGLKARLQKLWEKIKGVFKQVYAKLTVWLVRNGKAFVAMHRKTLATKTGLSEVKIPKYLKRKAEFDKAMSLNKEISNDFSNMVVAYKGGVAAEDATAIQNKMYSKIPGANSENLAEKFKEYVFEEKKDVIFGDLHISVEELFNNITSKSKAISDIKKASNEADKGIKTAIAEINKKAKEAEKQTEGSGKGYQATSKTCAAYETALTRVTKLQIKAIKDAVAQDRALIGALVAYSPKSESALLEACAWLEGVDEVNDAIEAPVDATEVADAVEEAKDDGVEIEINIDTDSEC